MSKHDYGHEPPTNDDGSYKSVIAQFGHFYLHPDGYTLESVVDGTTYDLRDIGGGSSTDTRTDVSDSGTTVVADTEDINFASFLSVTDDGDGTVTVNGQDDTIRTRQATIPLTEIGDTNTAVGLQKLVPTGKTLKILEVGVTDDAESAPAGLTIEVQDLTNAATIVSKNAKHAEGAPLASKSGAIDVQFRVANSTGGPVNASGYVLYTME